MNNKNTVAIVALGAIAVLLLSASGNRAWKGPSAGSSLLSGLSIPTGASIPSLNDTFNVTAAWSVFQDYLKAAKAHDIEKIKFLSYQISETCSNPAKKADCEGLMDSVYMIASGFKLEDFKNVFYDEKQIIMTTDYMKTAEGADPTKVVLYFAKAENGEPKVLGIRFCYGDEAAGNSSCVITDPDKRDADKDGWWDDVEALFYKK